MRYKGTRKLPDLIEAYEQMLDGTTAPKRWKRWVATWLVGAAAERRVWVRTMGLPIYPNMFVFLIGKSGGGKSVSFNMARTLLRSIGPGRTTSSSMTAAYFASQLQANERSFINPITKKAEPYNCANVCTTEMGTLFREADGGMLSMLTDLFDCGEFSEGRRNEKNTFECARTFCAMLVGGTMTHLFSAFTENHWSDGFMSRVVMIYDTPIPRGSLFKAEQMKNMNVLYDAIVNDLKVVASAEGEFEFTDEAAQLLDDFFTHDSGGGLQLGGPPVPQHPNLRTYCERRHIQIEKLMMNRALATGATILTAEHFWYAHEMLLDAESMMEEIFKEGAVGSDMRLINEFLYAMSKAYLKYKKHPIPEDKMMQFLLKKADSYKAVSIFETLKKTKKIRLANANEKAEHGIKGNDHYVPLASSWTEDAE